MTTIVALEAQNVKRLRAVSIKPDGSLIVIGGNNGNGKTSLLDSITFALGGKDALQSEPLRRGTNKGQVVIELDDGMVIKRTFTPNGSGTLTVSNKDGAKFTSPQKLLDSLVGKLTFDPLAFSRMEPKMQVETLLGLLNLDFTDLDDKRKKAFDKRTEVNREVKRIQGAINSMPAIDVDLPDKEVSVAELTEELELRSKQNKERQKEQRELEALRNEAIAIKADITKAEELLIKLKSKLKDTTAKGKEQATKVNSMPIADEDEIKQQLKNAESTNAKIRAGSEFSKLTVELQEQQNKAFAYTEEIQKYDNEKRNELAAAKYPINGLSFDDNRVTLNSLPLEQASSAEQLRASIAIGIAMNPKLKVMMVRDGSLLDEQSLSMVAQMAQEADTQVWLEKVGKGHDVSVIIEDGQVAVANENKQQKADPKKATQRMREPGED
jgi:DNA repair exonuclease SbcCD ATPase subunit